MENRTEKRIRWSSFSTTPEELLLKADEYRVHAYVPYSQFPVGAALLMDDGCIIGGCNVENGSFGLTICAERSAMVAAVASGKKKPLAVAVTGKDGVFCSPCGACRQFLSEFNPSMDIVLLNEGEIEIYSLSELLPWQFSFKGV